MKTRTDNDIMITSTSLNTIYNDKEYLELVGDLITNDKVRQMKNFNQHMDITCFDHCLYVSYYSYKIAKKYNLNYRSAARGRITSRLILI